MGRGIVLVPLLVVMMCRAYSQNCGCSSELCCSQFGYCGTGEYYCGTGCQQGPCYSNASLGGSGSVSPIMMLLEFNGDGTISSIITKRDSVSSIISKDFFDRILGGAATGCAGKNFYTYNTFLSAANAYSGFGTTGSSDDAKRELAAFFAHVVYETESFCYIEEVNGAQINYCETTNTYPCVSGKSYFRRGPVQLSWNYNYGRAGEDIGFDGLNEPEKVAQDAIISFKTSVWYWMKQSGCHDAMISGKGIGATIKAFNGGIECSNESVSSRYDFYLIYCRRLGVDPGPDLSC